MTEPVFEVQKTALFEEWMDGLRDDRAKAKIAARIDRMVSGNPGDVEPVGNGVSELRIHYGPGYRIYFTRRGMTLILLLCGGDKSTQAKDILTAKALAAKLEPGSCH
jgi:putative addiction module killer protein